MNQSNEQNTHEFNPLKVEWSIQLRNLGLYSKLQISLIPEDRETDLFDEAADLAIRIGYPADSSMILRTIAQVPRYVRWCQSRDTPA